MSLHAPGWLLRGLQVEPPGFGGKQVLEGKGAYLIWSWFEDASVVKGAYLGWSRTFGFKNNSFTE